MSVTGLFQDTHRLGKLYGIKRNDHPFIRQVGADCAEGLYGMVLNIVGAPMLVDTRSDIRKMKTIVSKKWRGTEYYTIIYIGLCQLDSPTSCGSAAKARQKHVFSWASIWQLHKPHIWVRYKETYTLPVSHTVPNLYWHSLQTQHPCNHSGIRLQILSHPSFSGHCA